MKNFKDLNVKSISKGFLGDKIKMDRILNREIVVTDFKIDKSKYKDKCLCLQIMIGETNHVVFTGSKVLMELITQINKKDFPFKTTIVKENQRYEFT